MLGATPNCHLIWHSAKRLLDRLQTSAQASERKLLATYITPDLFQCLPSCHYGSLILNYYDVYYTFDARLTCSGSWGNSTTNEDTPIWLYKRPQIFTPRSFPWVIYWSQNKRRNLHQFPESLPAKNGSMSTNSSGLFIMSYPEVDKNTRLLTLSAGINRLESSTVGFLQAYDTNFGDVERSMPSGGRSFCPNSNGDGAAQAEPDDPGNFEGRPIKRRKNTGSLRVTTEKMPRFTTPNDTAVPSPVQFSTARQLQPKPKGFAQRTKNDDISSTTTILDR